MVRSVLSVLVGFAVMVILVQIGVNAAAAMMLPPPVGTKLSALTSGYLIANLLISFVAAVQGGVITGRLAPSDPLRHASGLAAILAMLTLFSMLSPGAATGQPGWYLPVVGVVGIGGAMTGGKIQERRTKST